jgi:hypothetical protein
MIAHTIAIIGAALAVRTYCLIRKTYLIFSLAFFVAGVRVGDPDPDVVPEPQLCLRLLFDYFLYSRG